MPFEKGQSGCPGGRGKRHWRDALTRAVMKASEGGRVDYVRLDEIADAVVTAAIGGDIQAAKEIGDRLDGRAVQTIANGDDGAPFVIKVVRGTGE